MRLFVYEYLCSGVLAGQPAAESLRREGLAMFRAIVADLSHCPGVKLLIMLDPALLPPTHSWPPNLQIEAVQGEEQERGAFDRLARQADAALVIAPEFDDLLWQRCHWLEQLGVPHLGPSAAAVRQTGDKLALCHLWQQAGVPTPPCVSCSAEVPATPPWPLPWVLKPRQGAGSQATFLIERQEELPFCLCQARQEGWRGELLLQPLVSGQAASVALLIGPEQSWALPAAWQRLSSEGRFHYEGGRLPLPAELDERARRLATQAVQVVEGLRGYVGVDLVLGDVGGSDQVIEINPRLTTSYVGLRALADFNLAETLLAIATGAGPPIGRWHPGPIHFRAGGE